MNDTDESDTEYYSDDEPLRPYNHHSSVLTCGQLEKKFPPLHYNIPSLKDIAAATIAVSLWKSQNIPKALSTISSRHTSETNEWSSLRLKVCSLKSHSKLSLPHLMTAHVGNYIIKIETEIHDWVSYHFRNVFFENGSDHVLYYHIYDLVWYPNGSINRKETARKLMSSKRLSDIEKFRFLSTYCLIEEMETFPPAIFSDQITDHKPFDQYPLICYWNEYFRNKLFDSNARFGRNLTSNILMAQHLRVNNWPAKEYFFNFLSPQEQVECAKYLIHSIGLKYQKELLIKLNEIQRLQLYTDNAVEIMINYTKSCNYSYEILATWLQIRNLISRDEFVKIFKQYLKFKVDDTVLTNIWNEAPDHFKSFVLNYNDYEIIENILSYWKYLLRGELLYAVLSDIKPRIIKKITKKEYFSEFCEELIKRGQIPVLDRLLHICFHKSDEFVNFKQKLAFNSEHVKKTCISHYESKAYGHGDFSKVNEYLASLMPNRLNEYKKNLLMSNDGIKIGTSYLSSSEQREKLLKIIDDGLPTKELATEFRRNIIFSSTALCILRYRIKHARMDEVKEIIDTYLESDEDKRILKKRVINDVRLLRKLFIKLSKSQVMSIIQWCLEDDEAVEQFKTTIPLDEVFDEILKYCVFRWYDEDHRVSFCTFLRNPNFNGVDLFLSWYFGSSSKINRYKMQRVDSWLDIEMITTLLKKRNEDHLRATMAWFFQNNKKIIQKFKKKFAGERIVRMV